MTHPSLALSISKIVFLSPGKEMIWIWTVGIVAMVADIEPVRYRTLVKLVGKSRNNDLLAVLCSEYSASGFSD